MTDTQTDITAVRYERDDDGIVVLTLDDPTASANTMNELYQRSMHAAVDRLYDEVDGVRGVVVASAKKTFFAGGNLTLMMQATPDDAASVFAGIEAMKHDLRRLEKLPRPVVAAINGAALGGGFEIALACNHRIVVDDPAAVVGLPEATLGLLPGVGGVTRVTRMFGIQSALMDVLLQGRRFKPADAPATATRRRRRGLARGAAAGGQGLDPRAPRRRRRRDEPVGPRGLQDARRHSAVAEAGGVPAGLPGAAAAADEGRGVPGPAGDPVGRGRGGERRLRHREPDREPLPHRARRRPELQEHDTGLLLRPAGHQRREVPPARSRDVRGHQGRRARRRDDGRRHRVLLCARRHAGRAEGRLPRGGRARQGLQREAQRQGDRARQAHPGEGGRAARADHADRGRRRPRGLRPGDRGGLRGPEPQAPGVRRGRSST